jgi:hypothetical protein
MQISSINNISFGKISNSKRIFELEQKREQIKWASEGCTGGLNPEDEYELITRKQLQELRREEGLCILGYNGANTSLSRDKKNKLIKLENIVATIDEKLERPNKIVVFEKNLYSRPFVDVFQDDAINKN